MIILKYLPVVVLATTLNVGCGGGGGGTAASPNGIYSGNITGGQTVPNVIEEKAIIYNGRLLILSLGTTAIQQLFDASLDISSTSLSGTGKRYNNISLLNSVDYDGNFVVSTSATIDFDVTTGTPSNGLLPGTMNLTASTTLLERGSATDKLQGVWTGDYGSDFFGTMNLTIDATGTITAGDDQYNNSPDCKFTGTILPADTKINVYNALITSDGGSNGNCIMSAGTYTGLAWTEGDTDGTMVLMFADGTDGRAVILTRTGI